MASGTSPRMDIQNVMRRDLMYWHKSWKADWEDRQARLIFLMSLARAKGSTWASIGTAIGRSRENAFVTNRSKLYSDRADIIGLSRNVDEAAVLRDLAECERGIRDAKEELRLKVRQAWLDGASWITIGKALGVSHQAARRRFKP